MSYRVSPQDLKRIRLNEADTVSSVLQNIAIILTTRQQSVPLYRYFGLPMQFVDKPMEVAKTMMIAEITDAIREFEPRARVVGITFTTDNSNPGRLIPIVEVEITNEQES